MIKFKMIFPKIIHSLFQAFSSVQDATAHTHQPALESYEDTALFFISYAQVILKNPFSNHFRSIY